MKATDDDDIESKRIRMFLHDLDYNLNCLVSKAVRKSSENLGLWT